MNKWGVILTCLAVLPVLAGCAKRAMEGDSQIPITLNVPVVDTQTKTPVPGEIGVEYNISEQFRVWGWLSFSDIGRSNFTTNGSTPNGNVFFADVKAFQGGIPALHQGYWKLTPVYYWPKDPQARLTIHALSPFDVYSEPPAESDCASIEHYWKEPSDNAPVGFKVNSFSVRDNPAEQYELLYSDFTFNALRSDYSSGDPYDNDPEEAGFVYNGIDLKFNHALSSVQFKLKQEKDYEVEGARIRIFLTRMELRNAYKTGTFIENRQENAIFENASLEHPENAPNTYQLVNGVRRAKWDLLQTQHNYTLYTKGSISLKNGNGEWVEQSQSQDVPMFTDGYDMHVARNVKIERGLEIVFRKDLAWNEILGHIKGTIPYHRGDNFTVSPTGSDISILESGTYDILLNPRLQYARISTPQPDEAYASYVHPSNWSIHHTSGYKILTTAYGLNEKDAEGNYYIGGNNLLMIPQPLSHGAGAGNQVTLYVEYYIKYGDVDVRMEQEFELNGLGTPAITEWLPGKRYVYTLTFSLDKVSLKPAVTGWTTSANILE